MPRNQPILLVLLVTGLLTLGPGPAHAMHISEGILPASWALFWFALSAPFVLLGLRTLRLRSAQEPQVQSTCGTCGSGDLRNLGDAGAGFHRGNVLAPVRYRDCGNTDRTFGDSGVGEHRFDLACTFSGTWRLDHIGS